MRRESLIIGLLVRSWIVFFFLFFLLVSRRIRIDLEL